MNMIEFTMDNIKNRRTKIEICLNNSILLIFCLIIIGLVGCASTEEEPEDTGVASIQVLPDDEDFIALGQEVQLQAVATNAANMEIPSGTVMWDTSDPNILDISSSGQMTGLGDGLATISATAGGKTGSIDFQVVDLTGSWIGGEAPDTVVYRLIQTDTIVDGVFVSQLGFPPITDVKTGILTGYLSFHVTIMF